MKIKHLQIRLSFIQFKPAIIFNNNNIFFEVNFMSSRCYSPSCNCTKFSFTNPCKIAQALATLKHFSWTQSFTYVYCCLQLVAVQRADSRSSKFLPHFSGATQFEYQLSYIEYYVRDVSQFFSVIPGSFRIAACLETILILHIVAKRKPNIQFLVNKILYFIAIGKTVDNMLDLPYHFQLTGTHRLDFMPVNIPTQSKQKAALQISKHIKLVSTKQLCKFQSTSTYQFHYRIKHNLHHYNTDRHILIITIFLCGCEM